MRLSIVVPAYNEEEAVGDTVRACLAARDEIVEKGGVDDVEVIVVDDGSTDRTAEIVEGIARADEAVRLVRHERNRGYGAALETGFAAARGELLGFLDADGTCDPRAFATLVRVLLEERADMVSGYRLGPGNRMPLVRRLGNRFFALLVNAVAPQRVGDLASGMRVLRREVLPRLRPLPAGLHYTPAMSAKALFDPTIRLVEAPIPYAERKGESKLSVLGDGRRFLLVLGEVALSYRPFLFFAVPGLLLLLVAAAYAVSPLVHVMREGSVAEDQIYRLFTIVVLVSAGFSLVATGLLASDATGLVHRRARPPSPVHRACRALWFGRPFLCGTLLILSALLLDREAIASYLTEGRIHLHWFWVVAGGLMVLVGIQWIAFGALERILRTLAERRRAREQAAEGGEDRPLRAGSGARGRARAETVTRGDARS